MCSLAKIFVSFIIFVHLTLFLEIKFWNSNGKPSIQEDSLNSELNLIHLNEPSFFLLQKY